MTGTNKKMTDTNKKMTDANEKDIRYLGILKIHYLYLDTFKVISQKSYYLILHRKTEKHHNCHFSMGLLNLHYWSKEKINKCFVNIINITTLNIRS